MVIPLASRKKDYMTSQLSLFVHLNNPLNPNNLAKATDNNTYQIVFCLVRLYLYSN